MKRINIKNLISLGVKALVIITLFSFAFSVNAAGYTVDSGASNQTSNTYGTSSGGTTDNSSNSNNTGSNTNTTGLNTNSTNNSSVNNPSPTISYLSFSSANAGSNSVTLAITGTNFISGSSARWNGSGRSTVYQNSNQVLMTLTSSDLASAGVGSITVYNTTPGGGISNAVNFTVIGTTSYNGAPIISSINPTSAASGSGALTLTIYGSNFFSGSIARWNSSDRSTTFVNNGQLTMQITSADMNGSGHYLITVYNPAPGGGISNGVIFTILGGPTNGAVASTTANKTTSGTTTKASGTVAKTSKKTTSASDNSLAANALFGTNGFMPHNLIQWMYVFILVLLGMIFWRKIYMDDPERKAAPLKHK